MEPKIKKVISFTETELIVEMEDGAKVKRVGGTISWRHNNPGNLIFTAFSRRQGAIWQGLRKLSIFPSFQIGEAAHRELLFGTEKTYRNMTIKDAIAKYAPEYDNNDPVKYSAFIARQVGVKEDVILKDLTEVQKSLMIASMQRYEGFIPGKVIKV